MRTAGGRGNWTEKMDDFLRLMSNGLKNLMVHIECHKSLCYGSLRFLGPVLHFEWIYCFIWSHPSWQFAFFLIVKFGMLYVCHWLCSYLNLLNSDNIAYALPVDMILFSGNIFYFWQDLHFYVFINWTFPALFRFLLRMPSDVFYLYVQIKLSASSIWLTKFARISGRERGLVQGLLRRTENPSDLLITFDWPSHPSERGLWLQS